MAKVTRETGHYKWVTLFESKTVSIQYVQDKVHGMEYDRIRFIKYGTTSYDAEIFNVFRYEDEQLIEEMKRMYGAE